jgi:hydroxymethylpyrimidine/phosphomethylpyrimidine kinase
MDGRVLSIAGSDSGGGAGIQADIKTITALGGFASTVVTALTAQNTLGVAEVSEVDPWFVERQLEVVLEDIGADAIKTGMLANRATVELVARGLQRLAQRVPIIVDPVMVSSSGHSLLDKPGRDAIAKRLIPMCALVTPNTVEAGLLAGFDVTDESSMQRAADHLLVQGAAAVLIKGGHLDSDTVIDILRTADGHFVRFESERQSTSATHGTGCTLSAAIATYLAQGLTLESAVGRSIEYVQSAMRWAVPIGKGRATPLDHGFSLRQRPPAEPVH